MTLNSGLWGCHVLGTVAGAFADDQAGHQTGNAGVDMHDGAARVVQHALLLEEAAAPDPMHDRRVDDHGPKPDEEQNCGELHPVCDRAGDQRRRDDAEGQLEYHVERLRERAPQRIHVQVREEQHPEVAHVLVVAREREAEADENPDYGDEAADGETLAGDRKHVLATHHAAVEHRDAGHRHHQAEHRRRQHPAGGAAVECRCGFRPERRHGSRDQRHAPNPDLPFHGTLHSITSPSQWHVFTARPPRQAVAEPKTRSILLTDRFATAPAPTSPVTAWLWSRKPHGRPL